MAAALAALLVAETASKSAGELHTGPMKSPRPGPGASAGSSMSPFRRSRDVRLRLAVYLRICLLTLSGLSFTLYLTGCGGGSSGSGSGSATAGSAPLGSLSTSVVDAPTAIDLYPHQSSTEEPIFTLMVTSVGSVAVNMPLGFDTGSAGITLYAQSIFPASMVSTSGFIFPAGQTSISYNGITVTNISGTRTYGTLNQTVEHGNLGFATVAFGDSAGQISTQTLPIFFFYSVDDLAGSGYQPPTWQGWFGVASTADTIDVAGSSEPATGYGACTPQSTGTCYVVSALKYIDYGSDASAGFVLSPASSFPTCDITTPGSCPAQSILTVGVNAGIESSFSTSPLSCPPNGYVGPPTIAEYLVCQKTINNVTVTASGSSTGSYTSGMVFDSGTAYVYLSTPANSSFPAPVEPGSTIAITTPSGFNYAYVAGSGTANTVVAPANDGNSIMGAQYFTTNSLLLDYESSLVGWR